MQKFLSFVVENALTGNVDRLKEIVVGIEVFDRQPGYDPKLDSIVRTEARRLRSKLEQYYSSEGLSETLIIRMSKGGYLPVFESANISSLLPSAPILAPAGEPNLPIELVPVAALPKPSRPFPMSWRKLSFLAVALAMLLGSISWYAFSRKASYLPLRTVPLTGNAGAEITPALSPDGRQIAYAWKEDEGEFNIYVKLVDIGDPVRLTVNSGHNVSPSWSPDGEKIAFLRAAPSRTEVVIVPALGGLEQILLTLQGGFDRWLPYGPQNGGRSGPVWSKDGKALIVCDSWQNVNCGLLKVELGGSVTHLTRPGRGDLDFSPAVSPDGKHIAFVRGIPGAADIYVVPSQGGTPLRVTHDRVEISGVSWWDQDTLLYGSVRGGNMGLWRTRLSGAVATVSPFATETGAGSPSVASNHHRIAYVASTEQQSIWRRSLAADGSSTTPQHFIFSSRRDHSPKYSPDGQHVAFVSDRSGAWEIWMCQSDGSRATRLTNFGGVPVGTPRWSPDSRSLAFDAKVGAHTAIWILDVLSARNAPRRLSPSDHENLIPTWSRDGKWIYFLSDRTGHNELWKQNIASGQALVVFNDSAMDATESVDGNYLFYERSNNSIFRIQKAAGTAAQVPELADFRMARNWEVTGDGIYFATSTQTSPVLGFLPFNRRPIVTLGHLSGDMVYGTPSLSVSPDGRWLLYAQQEPRRSSIMIMRYTALN